MPESRYVESKRLFPLLGYVAFALVLLLVLDFAAGAMEGPSRLRQLLIPAWVIGFPIGGWFIWRRG